HLRELSAEDLLPLHQVLDVALGRPGLEAFSPRAVADAAALDVDQQVRAVLAVHDEVEALELRVGEEGLLGFVHGDVGNAAVAQERLEGGFVMDVAVGHDDATLYRLSAES